jgi:cytoskeletal protein RodZ
MGEFGEKFRKAREKKELSLDDVSNVTKISSRMLRAIEEEHFDDLPGGVFNKGFIRAYAKHLGLDAEEAVTDYLASLRQAQIDAHEVWEPPTHAATRARVNGGKPQVADNKKTAPRPSAPKPSTPVEVEELPDLQLPRVQDVHPARKESLHESPSGIPWKIVAAAALVVALGIFLWVRHSNRLRTAVAASHQAVSATSQPAAALLPVIQKPAPAPEAPSASKPAPSQPPAQSPPKSAPVSAATTVPAPAPDNNDSTDVTVKTVAKSTPKSSEKSAPSLSLVIRATENSWISVFSDGQLVTQETLIAPAHTSVRASREISVRIGNAAGVTFVLNGHEIPVQGAESEVKNFAFDASGMHENPPIAQVP